ncbi:MAG TPA: GNAT family N-acetyltransferase [Oscillospiraceae bacterium]|nr:GNAT family N-acetyltransferase [Oscillospiraceae bacterium]
MYCLKKEDRYRIASLFSGWDETLLWSCLQGYMGNAWADDIQNPKSAQIVTADFCFFAGVPNRELVQNIPGDFPSPWILMVPQNQDWARLIEQEYTNGLEQFMRYAVKKEPEVFDRENLRFYIEKLPTEYSIKKIDEEIYKKLLNEEWSKDFCSQFPTYCDFEERGLGFVALYQNEPVSGASSYTVYDKGIEIELDTKKEYRRKGLAIACASKLILKCLDKGLYPSWDAANKGSLALAEKLGYHFDKEYVTYAIKINQ